MKIKRCPHCGLDLSTIENPMNRGNHVRWCEKNPKRKQEKIKTPKICKFCGSEFFGRRSTCYNKECEYKNRLHSKEAKQLMSQKRKKFLKESPDKHPWKKSNKFKSKPCEDLKNILRLNNIQFIEEFKPLPDRYFSIDILIPHISLGIEVNGNQHYERNGELKSYYKERHDLIESTGITLIELPYYIIYEISIDEILSIGKKEPFKFKIKEKKKKPIPGQKNKDKRAKLVVERRILLDDSEIDLTKYGWVNCVAKLWGITPQKVNEWMKKYYPDLEFFERKKCK